MRSLSNVTSPADNWVELRTTQGTVYVPVHWRLPTADLYQRLRQALDAYFQPPHYDELFRQAVEALARAPTAQPKLITRNFSGVQLLDHDYGMYTLPGLHVHQAFVWLIDQLRARLELHCAMLKDSQGAFNILFNHLLYGDTLFETFPF